uniref:Ribosome biogenesis protein NOP53 n=1 Tax=Chelydra serpentina TaxID=8475 RepID=A0A8C3XQC3_CHESE
RAGGGSPPGGPWASLIAPCLSFPTGKTGLIAIQNWGPGGQRAMTPGLYPRHWVGAGDVGLTPMEAKGLLLAQRPQPPSSCLAPFGSILAHQVPNGKKRKRKQQLREKLAERGLVPREQHLLQARRQRAAAEAAHGQGAGAEPAGGFYDIWSDTNPLDRPLAGQDAWFLEQTKKQRVRRPARLEKKPLELPAVDVIPPGGSYNPTFQAHQALLLQAHEVELRRQKAEEKLERQLRFPTAAETAFREQCEGLLEESADEGSDEETPHEPPAPGAPPLLAPLREKKTEQQRRREKEAKFLVPDSPWFPLAWG